MDGWRGMGGGEEARAELDIVLFSVWSSNFWSLKVSLSEKMLFVLLHNLSKANSLCDGSPIHLSLRGRLLLPALRSSQSAHRGSFVNSSVLTQLDRWTFCPLLGPSNLKYSDFFFFGRAIIRSFEYS